MSIVRVACVAVAFVALSACRSLGGSCPKPPEYVSYENLPPLKVPSGLEMPDTSAALRIPTLESPERPRGENEPCLDAPPPYSTTTTTPAADAPQPST